MAHDAFRVQQLRDERARQLNVLDDISRTCTDQGRTTLTADEARDLDFAQRRIDQLDAELGRGDVSRAAHYATVQPNVGRYRGTERRHSLDERLWATADVVRAGKVDGRGVFRADPSGATVDVEQVVIRTESTGDTGMTAPRLAAIAADDRDAVRAFQTLVADMAVFGLVIDKSARTSADGFEVARSHRAFADRYADVLRALDVDTSGEGGTWVPTGIGAAVHEMVRAQGRVAPLFQRLNLPTNPWKWPIEGSDAVAYRVAEPTSDTSPKVAASTPGTVAATFDAEIFGARTLISRSLDADSAVLMVPYLRNKLARAVSIAEERAILDGDNDGTHQDADVQALGATDPRSAWDGLRKRALAQTVATATSASAANLLVLRKAMGKWGLDPAELAFIIGVSNMHTLLADTNLMTVDKMGPNATLLAGQIGAIAGVPVIVSEHVREDLNASGVQDGITTNKTVMLCVNRSAWAIGQRMALDIEVDDSIYRESYQRLLVGFMREDFQHIGAAATDDDTAIAANVTV